MSRFRILAILTLSIFILPMFYSHFSVLPGATRYFMDLMLIVYFLLYKPLLTTNHLGRTSGFQHLYMTYVVLILLISMYSVVLHGENFTYWFQEFRRLFYPLVFYVIIQDIFSTDKLASIKLHRLLFFIYVLQIPVTFIQRFFQGFLRRTPLYSGLDRAINEVDFAMGTLGGGGASFLGVVIPMVILYLYDLKIFKWSIPFVIPLIAIFSGGGIVLAAISVAGILIYVFLAKPFGTKFKILSAAAFVFGLFFVLYSSFTTISEPVNRYIQSFEFYTENYVVGGKETFVNEEHKIDRLNGHKFLRRHMNEAEYEQLLGLGFTFKENNGGLEYQYKSDFNYILAERGFLGLGIYSIFIILIMVGILRLILAKEYTDWFIKILYFGIFFIAGFYNPSSRSFQTWLMFVYFLVLLEHRDQYFSLKNYLHETKHRNSRKKRGAQISHVPDKPS